MVLLNLKLVLNFEVLTEKLCMNCFLLFIPAVYPPVAAPAANMFGNVPGYEGIGGGKRSPILIFSDNIYVSATLNFVVSAGGYLPPPMPLEPVAPPQPGPEPDDWR